MPDRAEQEQEQVPQGTLERLARAEYEEVDRYVFTWEKLDGRVRAARIRRAARTYAVARKEVLGEVEKHVARDAAFLQKLLFAAEENRHRPWPSQRDEQCALVEKQLATLQDQPSTLDHGRELAQRVKDLGIADAAPGEGVTRKDIDRGVELDEEHGWSEVAEACTCEPNDHLCKNHARQLDEAESSELHDQAIKCSGSNSGAREKCSAQITTGETPEAAERREWTLYEVDEGPLRVVGPRIEEESLLVMSVADHEDAPNPEGLR